MSQVLTLLLLEFGFGGGRCGRQADRLARLNPSFTGIWLRGLAAKEMISEIGAKS